MMARLGLSGRLLAIIFLVLFAAVALGAGTAFVERQRQGAGPRLPLPDQAAAIVTLLDRADAADRALILRAANTDNLAVAILPIRPDFADNRQRMASVEWFVSQYLEAVGEREVIAAIDVAPPDAIAHRPVLPLLRNWLFAPGPLKLGIQLKSGGYVVFATREPLGPSIFGLPAGFGIGAFGAALALLAIYGVMREARPLKRLSAALAQFSVDAKPIAIVAEGAPEIRTLIQATNAMQSRIAALLKGRTVLLGAISHDLKTYLTRLRLRVEAIDDASERNKASNDIDDMTALIDDALAIARGAAELPLTGEADLVAILRRDLSDRPSGRVTWQGSTLRQALVKPADAVALARLVANLLDNAERYADHAQVGLAQIDGSWVMTVDDDGPGIPEPERDTIFEPFHRLETSRNRATGGTGLGLAIARQVAERHGGSIHVAVSPMGGARMVVRLPVTAVSRLEPVA